MTVNLVSTAKAEPTKPAAFAPVDGALHQAAGGDLTLDRIYHAALGSLTGGFSLVPLHMALTDWLEHLAISPTKQSELWTRMAAEWIRLAELNATAAAGGGHCEPCRRSLPQDRRFRGELWHRWPFSSYAEAFLGVERWWDEALTGVHGLSAQNRDLLRFAIRQMLDTMAPSNFPLSNPDILARIRETSGACLFEGWLNLAEDAGRVASGRRLRSDDAFAVGKNVATTEGKVVLRTPIAELIQYSPKTEQVRPEPLLIVPAWIMKYYILDLSRENSLIRHLVEAGFTVFCLSWKNPTAEDRDVSFDDYRRLAVMPAIEAALAITEAKKLHTVGYCLGGTLLAITAAAMARDDDQRLASLSFLAAQTDFEEAGELRLFINESQIALLEDIMYENGVLSAPRMQGTFNLLRSNDLIWSRIVRHYWMGNPDAALDMSAWAADATRLPYRMHAEYLRSLYLNNDLAEGRFLVDGRPVVVQDIRAPLFALGTEWDHVAPWRSVFKFNLLAETDVTFALTNGGHNQGVVSPPGRSDRHYRIATRHLGAPYVDPQTWLTQTAPHPGSWWPAWFEWLANRSGKPVAPPSMANAKAGFSPLEPAPGTYVFE